MGKGLVRNECYSLSAGFHTEGGGGGGSSEAKKGAAKKRYAAWACQHSQVSTNALDSENLG